MLTITTYPDPVLRKTTEPINEINDKIRALIEDMAEVMYADDGVGLAANQVGKSIRMIVLDAGEGFRALLNPEIIERGEDTGKMEEGCLSLPGIKVEVERPLNITVTGLDEDGNEVCIQAEGLLARVLQHEIDHLNGILIIDHGSSLQRRMMRSKLKKLEKDRL